MNKSACLIVLLLLAACARSPDSIAAAPVPDNAYRGSSCSVLAAEKRRVDNELARMETRQRDARIKDSITVFTLFVPLASMTDRDHEPAVARLKGERDALARAQSQKGC